MRLDSIKTFTERTQSLLGRIESQSSCEMPELSGTGVSARQGSHLGYGVHFPAERGSNACLLGIFGLALLAHELREIVVASRRLARRPGHFPSAEWLHAHDGPCRCPRGAIRVEDAGYNFGEEPADLGRLAGKDAGGEPVVAVVRHLDGVVESIHLEDGEDRDEQLLFVDSMVSREPRHDRRIDEMSDLGIRLPAEQDLP